MDALGVMAKYFFFSSPKTYYAVEYGVGIRLKVIVIDLGANIEKLNEWLC